MAIILSRQIFSPTTLLYAFVLVSQFGFGLYLGRLMEAPPAFIFLHWVGQLWIIGWWLRADSRKRRVAWIYDVGLFLLIAWPIVMTCHLVKTRGAKGLLVILGFITAYFGAAIAGIVVSLAVIVGPQ
jgi:hypothetical protein